MDGVKIIHILLVILIVGVIIYLLRLFRTANLEKRIAVFALNSEENIQISFLDRVINLFWKVSFKLSDILKKSLVMRQYGEKYNKYIAFKDQSKMTGIMYVAAKFAIAFLVSFLYLLVFLLKARHISLMILLVIFIISFFSLDIVLKVRFNKRRKQIEEDLLKAIIIMNNAFQSGRNIMQAVECVKEELDGPIQDEFKKIYLDMTYGLSLEVVFNRFYERIKIPDAKYITSSLTLLNKTGGDIVKVFSLIQKSIFDKKNLKNELKSLTASSEFVFKMLVFLPFVFILLIFVLNPSYFVPLFTTTLGIILLILTCLLYIMYILVVKRVLEVEM